MQGVNRVAHGSLAQCIVAVLPRRGSASVHWGSRKPCHVGQDRVVVLVLAGTASIDIGQRSITFVLPEKAIILDPEPGGLRRTA